MPDKLAQIDFSAGMFRIDSGQIPESGAYDLLNLLIGVDGQPFRRGGTSYISAANFGTKLTWMWALPGSLDVVVMNPTNMGLMRGDTGAVVNTGAAGSIPGLPAVINGIMYLPGIQYGGSQKTAYTYSTGTVAVTQGSTLVTGTGSAIATNTDEGSLIRIAGAGPWYRINGYGFPLGSPDIAVLDRPYIGATGSGLAYEVRNVVTDSSGLAVNGFYYAAIGNRLVAASGSRIVFSAVNDASVGNANEDYHELNEYVIGLHTLGDLMLAFTGRGYWAIENMALDLTDSFGNPQQSLRKINGNLVLWHERGIVEYEGALIVPGVDDIWMIDSVSRPRSIGWQISPLLKTYANLGHTPGVGAIYQNHYILPIMDFDGDPVDLLVCRLDRPVGTPLGTAFPWTRLSGFGAQVSAAQLQDLQNSAFPEPRLILAGATATSRVLRAATLTPDPSITSEADGSNPTWRLTTRDYPVDGFAKSVLKKLRIRYQSAEWIDVTASTDYGTTTTNLLPTQGSGPDATGTSPGVWTGNIAGRHMRFQLSGTGLGSRMVIRAIELFLRRKGRQ